MRDVLVQLLCVHTVASDLVASSSELPPANLTATRGPWWPLRSDRRLELDPECSGGSTATRWRVVVTDSAPCGNGSEECPLSEISFGGDGVEAACVEPQTEAECAAAAEAAGLALGGAGFSFAGAYSGQGCYSYSSGEYQGMAYWSTGTNSLAASAFRVCMVLADTVEFELAEPGPPGTVLISAGSSSGSEARWPLALDVEYHDGQADSRWRFYSRVTELLPTVAGCTFTAGDGSGGTESGIGDAADAQACAAMVAEQEPTANGATYSNTGGTECYAEFGQTSNNGNANWQNCMFTTSEDLLTVTLVGDDNRCHTEIELPPRVSPSNRDASCESGEGEWLEAGGVRICCRQGALWCRKVVANTRKELATGDVLPPTTDGPERWASGERGPGLELSAGATYRRWDNVEGSSMDELFADPDFVDAAPTFQDVILDFFETPRNVCENCASELSGYFLAPVTGDYTFKMTSDDEGVLYLGESDTDAAPEIIARVSGYTQPERWDVQTEQTSEPQQLVAQTFYPIRGLSNEGCCGDFLRVGVILPDGTPLLPIPVDGYIFTEV